MAELWQATLAGLLMDGTPDADGVEWGIEAIDGWDSPDVRSSDSDRTGRHGTFGPVALFGGRPLTVKGWADCPDMATAFAVRDRLHSLTEGDLVRHESVPKQVEVTRGGVIRSSEPIDGTGTVLVTFQIPLIAHYPFKRATTARTTTVGAGSSVAATNDGTAPADLLVTLTSGGTVVLSAGGVTLTTEALPSGAVIDTAASTVRDSSGVDMFHLVSLPALMPALPKGGGFIAQAGTANLSVDHFDTYA